MSRLDELYLTLIESGFVMLKLAFNSRNMDWMKEEIEMLHNVPSLIDEKNKERHRYFWTKERTHYIQWVAKQDREDIKSRADALYDPIWIELDPIMRQLLSE